MKTIFTLLIGFLISLSAIAADHRESQLTINVQDRGNVSISVDGRRMRDYNNSVFIRDIDPGFHRITVTKFRTNVFFGILGSRFETVYNSSVRVKPGTEVKVTIDRFGKAWIDEKMIRGDRDDDYDNDHDGRNRRDRDWKDHDRRDDRYDRHDDYSRAMNTVEFNRVLEGIQREWFEANKMKSATYIIQTNYFTALQVKQMMDLFSFENNKLELAKQAYSKTVDQQNYQYVFDELRFSSSKNELARFIRDRR